MLFQLNNYKTEKLLIWNTMSAIKLRIHHTLLKPPRLHQLFVSWLISDYQKVPCSQRYRLSNWRLCYRITNGKDEPQRLPHWENAVHLLRSAHWSWRSKMNRRKCDLLPRDPLDR